MPLIYIHTDNTDVKYKIYSGFKAGKSAAAAEQKLQKVVQRVVAKAAGFTMTKGEEPPKGYTIKLEVFKVEAANGKTKCVVSGGISYYPLTYSNTKEGKGEEMRTTSMSSNGTADGTNERSLLDCIDAVAEDLVQKSIPVMRTDYDKRYGDTSDADKKK